MKTKTCPHCEGKGWVRYGAGENLTTAPCTMCHSTGELPDPHCGFVYDHPAGPHPGCAEFDGGATVEEECFERPTHRMLLFDEYANQYAPQCPDGDEWLLCDEHADLLLHDLATGMVLGLVLLSDEAVAA